MLHTRNLISPNLFPHLTTCASLSSTLQPKDRTPLKVLDAGSDGTQIDGLRELPVKSPEEIMALLQAGEAHRHYGNTSMNERSSRSHTIFRLVIESSASENFESSSDADGGDSEGGGSVSGNAITVSHLNLVDLAGYTF